jgi:hypothetical protein
MGYGNKKSTRNPGGNRRKKVSEYGAQLKEKQKVKFVYGVQEKQFHKYYLKASNMKGITGENMLRLLELPEEALDLVKSGDLSSGHARALLSLKNPEFIPALARRIVAKGLSVREVEQLIRRENAEPVAEQPEISGSMQQRIWIKELERRSREQLGRKVKITQNDKKKSIELFYDDDEDMEVLLVTLCGDRFFQIDEDDDI